MAPLLLFWIPAGVILALLFDLGAWFYLVWLIGVPLLLTMVRLALRRWINRHPHR